MHCEARGNAWIPGSNIAARGRSKVPVTLLPSKRRPWERQVEMHVSPHLKIETPLAEITSRAMRRGRDSLEALCEFVREQSRA